MLTCTPVETDPGSNELMAKVAVVGEKYWLAIVHPGPFLGPVRV